MILADFYRYLCIFLTHNFTQISQGITANLPSYSQFGENANNGAAVANAAIERKYKASTSSILQTAPQIPTPKGNDGKKYRKLLPKNVIEQIFALTNVVLYC